MVKSVRKSARLTSTLFGGVSCMPSAMRSIASPTMMRVNAVVPTSAAGARVSAVRTARIFSAVATSDGFAFAASMRISTPGRPSDCAATAAAGTSSSKPAAASAASSARRIAACRRIERERAHLLAALSAHDAPAVDLDEEQRQPGRDAPGLEHVDPPWGAGDAAKRAREEALQRVDRAHGKRDYQAEREREAQEQAGVERIGVA